MGCVDRTNEFRTQVKDLARRYPPAPPKKRRRSAEKTGGEDQSEDGFLIEAYAIVSFDFARHIIS